MSTLRYCLCANLRHCFFRSLEMVKVHIHLLRELIFPLFFFLNKYATAVYVFYERFLVLPRISHDGIYSLTDSLSDNFPAGRKG